MKRIIFAQAQGGYKIFLRYDDGVAGTVDLSAHVGKGVFTRWNDPACFASVQIDRRGRALVWAGEIDLCADALYLEITGLRPEDLFPALRQEAVHA